MEVYQNLSGDHTEGIEIRKEQNLVKLTVVNFNKSVSVYLSEKQIIELYKNLILASMT
jgi:hypothetical protein|uniref:Uncharacterized protein n=1 Tax=Myoviridae sp. ctCo31 TaxID=2825053 RepID=A0A8S5UM95_9CAUD|nr:MAG TPA: hypothetical protein [Myoviridae sp. ctCo31]